MAQPKKSVRGAARMSPNGTFELYLGGVRGAARAACTSAPLREFVREYYDFLCSPDMERQIGENIARKVRTRTGKVMTSFDFLEGFTVRLIRTNGDFAVFIMELPFFDVVEEQPAGEEAPEADSAEAAFAEDGTIDG